MLLLLMLMCCCVASAQEDSEKVHPKGPILYAQQTAKFVDSALASAALFTSAIGLASMIQYDLIDIYDAKKITKNTYQILTGLNAITALRLIAISYQLSRPVRNQLCKLLNYLDNYKPWE